MGGNWDDPTHLLIVLTLTAVSPVLVVAMLVALVSRSTDPDD